MPSHNYREVQIERLSLDAEYASLYLEISFSEALQDSFVGGFLTALDNVVIAAERSPGAATETDILRARLHHSLSEHDCPTIDIILSAMETIGLTHALKPVSAQVHS
ncbi:MAG: hypothetical protein AAGN15_22995 [Cyanobacteria bacterium J06581_3]